MHGSREGSPSGRSCPEQCIGHLPGGGIAIGRILDQGSLKHWQQGWRNTYLRFVEPVWSMNVFRDGGAGRVVAEGQSAGEYLEYKEPQ